MTTPVQDIYCYPAMVCSGFKWRLRLQAPQKSKRQLLSPNKTQPGLKERTPTYEQGKWEKRNDLLKWICPNFEKESIGKNGHSLRFRRQKNNNTILRTLATTWYDNFLKIELWWGSKFWRPDYWKRPNVRLKLVWYSDSKVTWTSVR